MLIVAPPAQHWLISAGVGCPCQLAWWHESRGRRIQRFLIALFLLSSSSSSASELPARFPSFYMPQCPKSQHPWMWKMAKITFIHRCFGCFSTFDPLLADILKERSRDLHGFSSRSLSPPCFCPFVAGEVISVWAWDGQIITVRDGADGMIYKTILS